ncbi:DHA2 family efflux MFS transporter permease subunit [Rothia sp. AR01]|uniref:DHA2 family efflux MFS transporter permease subunit n=1 Tax=Rothia santali TaxID=2949643 RepID=A0A9X2HIP4_9MICC|nr:DHA2 family efflux MFS transporter permease subunit [Rothia santali]MCP3426421.1 DHA2 family efflux MFS transporter permease subunit [Rothia santali]
MILVDTTIVSTAMPAIMRSFGADINQVVWVTSAYLLAYAVPLLITGRLGDRFGPRNLYLLGLTVFTLASLWCGFAPSIEVLIIARILQGLGAAVMTPQTMAVITRLFPPDRRGPAMGVWGAVAGVATLVGPIAGGLLVDNLGWEWIFFVNIPVGVFAFVRAWQKVPALSRHAHRIDVVSVLLSALGMFGIIFGIQEGHGHAWGAIWGPVTVVQIIVAGVVLMIAFVVWQRLTPSEPLIPLGLFSDRNFSLGNAAISMVGLMVTSFALPFMIYLQLVRGLSPTQAALMLAPMAVVSGVLAPFVGKRLTAVNAPWVAVLGTTLNSLGLVGYFLLLRPETPIGLILIPSFVMGVGGACMWAPISVTTTRHLDPARAGAGAGVYNTTRQIGAVFGSALIAMLMENRLAAQLPGMGGAAPVGEMTGGAQLPEALQEGFSTAMGQAILLPAAAGLAAALLALCFKRSRRAQAGGAAPGGAAEGDPAEAQGPGRREPRLRARAGGRRTERARSGRGRADPCGAVRSRAVRAQWSGPRRGAAAGTGRHRRTGTEPAPEA